MFTLFSVLSVGLCFSSLSHRKMCSLPLADRSLRAACAATMEPSLPSESSFSELMELSHRSAECEEYLTLCVWNAFYGKLLDRLLGSHACLLFDDVLVFRFFIVVKRVLARLLL